MSGLTNYVLRGGYRSATFWRTDTGASLSTSMVRHVAFADEPVLRELATGQEDEVARRRSIVPEIPSEDVCRTLRAWKAAGAQIRGLFVARGQGRHYQWEEPSRIILGPFDSLPGSFTGDRLRLSTARYAAAVYEDTSLLAPRLFGTGGNWLLYKSNPGGTGSVTWGTDADGNVTATLSAPAGETVALYVDRVLPVPGLVVSFALWLGAIGIADALTAKLRASALTYAESLTPVAYNGQASSTVEELLIEADGNAAESMAYTIPAGAYAVRFAVELAAVEAVRTLTFKLPVLLTRGVGGEVVSSLAWGIKVFELGASRFLTTYGPSTQATTTYTTPGGVGVQIVTVTGPSGLVVSTAEPNVLASPPGITGSTVLNTDN